MLKDSIIKVYKDLFSQIFCIYLHFYNNVASLLCYWHFELKMFLNFQTRCNMDIYTEYCELVENIKIYFIYITQPYYKKNLLECCYPYVSYLPDCLCIYRPLVANPPKIQDTTCFPIKKKCMNLNSKSLGFFSSSLWLFWWQELLTLVCESKCAASYPSGSALSEFIPSSTYILSSMYPARRLSQTKKALKLSSWALRFT